MLSKVRNTAMALAALGAIAFGASAIAGAADNSTNSSGSSAQGNRPAAPRLDSNGIPAQRSDETLLTDGTAEKVKAAALAKVPGATIIRVETDAQGSPYEAHMRKSDGSLVTAKVDKDFNVTKVEDWGGPGGPGGHGGPPPASNGSGTSSGASFQTTYQ